MYVLGSRKPAFGAGLNGYVGYAGYFGSTMVVGKPSTLGVYGDMPPAVWGNPTSFGEMAIPGDEKYGINL